MSSQQLFIDFKTDKNLEFNESDFILCEENNKAFSLLTKFFSQNKSDTNIIKSIILKGDKYCGKTHLFKIFSKQFDVTNIDLTELSNINFADFFKSNQFYILEDIDKISDQKLLFHIINCANENNSFLAMSAQSLNNFSLKDLDSRIKNIIKVEIENLKSDSMKLFIVNILSRKQLKISNNIVDFIVKNSDRNFEKIFFLIEKIENYCFEYKKSPNYKDIEKWI